MALKYITAARAQSNNDKNTSAQAAAAQALATFPTFINDVVDNMIAFPKECQRQLFLVRVESKTRTYHGRVGSGRPAGRPGGVGRY